MHENTSTTMVADDDRRPIVTYYICTVDIVIYFVRLREKLVTQIVSTRNETWLKIK